jgi:hypothetical protein
VDHRAGAVEVAASGPPGAYSTTRTIDVAECPRSHEKTTSPRTSSAQSLEAFQPWWPTRWPGVGPFAQLHRSALGLTTSAEAMASLLHEALVELLAEHPELLIPALQEQLGDLPVDLQFRRGESSQSKIPPLRADLGLELLLHGAAEPFAAITLEVQLSKDEDKPYSWLLYHAGQHYRLRVPSYLLVVTNDPDVAAWAAGPFRSGMVTMRPLVITPAHIPPVTDVEEAKRSLERAFLSGLVHASEPVAAEIGLALAAALDAAPDDAGLYYWDTLLAVLGDAIRRTIDMQLKNWKPRSDWGKQFLAEVKEEVRAAGLAAGRAEGRAEGQADAILAMLDARGLALDPPLRERITACTNLDLLARWVRRAATASSVEEVLAS